MKFVFLLVLVAGFAGYSLASSPWRLFNLDTANDGYTGPAPENYQAHPNGFWYGTQDLLCIMGIKPEDITDMLPDFISSHISKRSAPRRTTFNPIHRMVFYKGHVYEWGTGHNGYHFGREAVTRDCAVTWEKSVAGYSSCPAHTARDFLYNYREQYGTYNLVTNNCHHFANRLSELLSVDTCTVPRNGWAELARDTWKDISRGSFKVTDLFHKITGTDSEEEEIPVVD